jgi:hypothetical protein
MRNRLKMKGRSDMALAITDRLFNKCAAISYCDKRNAETVEQFLSRGGKINKINERRKS